MTHLVARVLVFLGIVYTSIFAFSTPTPAKEIVSGRIVAYAGPLTCLNENAYWSMVIRVQSPKEDASQFIRVQFSLPCGDEPQWLKAKSSIQKFHLIREKESDES